MSEEFYVTSFCVADKISDPETIEMICTMKYENSFVFFQDLEYSP